MNRSYINLLFLLLVGTSPLWAQKENDILLTINDEAITVNEFQRVYEKNLDLVQDEEQREVDNYLKLFIDYKLKVAEAKAQGLDQKDSYLKEFTKYQNQLSRNYIYEGNVSEELAKEAYERSLEEVHVAHILILSSYEDTPQDTLAAFNKIQNIRDEALSGKDFKQLAKKYSEEPNAERTGGDLGFFTVFNMVYPFETMAYQTEVGEVSEIVRTSFGYHIMKVFDRRPREGEVTAAHIMITDQEDKTRNFDPKERIEEVYSLLKQGTAFDELAKQYSEDRNSAKNGGKLRRFGRGTLRSKRFEEKVYSMQVDETSEPFKSEFGWHIVHLIEKHPIPSYEDQKESLLRRVAQGERSKIVTSSVNQTIKDKYGYSQKNNYYPLFHEKVGEEILQGKWDATQIPSEKNKILFEIGDREVYYQDFASFLQREQNKRTAYTSKVQYLSAQYEAFETETLKSYLLAQLEKENEEYAAIISEYRDGLLIFDVMNSNIWERAKNDSIGLINYYKEHEDDFQWKKRVEATIIQSSDETAVKQARNLLRDGMTVEQIKDSLNTTDRVSIIASQGIYEVGDPLLPAGISIEKGVSEIKDEEGNHM
ncbi:MAG: peptidylprolyl isomerase, partial [Flavobacteriaceae bacterium]|nr:peptidylprolyl isomerase [Flavobacteriaceae bacterium]